MSLGRIKGDPVMEFLYWFAERFGKRRVAEIAAQVDLERVSGLDLTAPAFGIMPKQWYDAETIHALCDAFNLATDEATANSILREGTEVATEATVGGPLRRLMLRLIISPNMYLRNANTLWRQYFDTGHIEVRQTSKTGLLWTIDDWTSHHRMLCQMVTLSEPTVFGAMGCVGVRSVETACVSRGDSHCAHTIEWESR